ncbi:COG4422 Bacteriophage protein gp37 [uncultured Caudovirales phage]|uniref:COG4422 Bacteriophage protein gp37 n=1 Tax=uncultured Caudovirales phage TaxID=2100421 RepID=A0A6J5LTT9_9CAUD|nr:COG4422 Bacteriophage protein gp37 [uncultured Caudovirales phage]
MAENSAIEWTDHTFNPWIGCQAVSPACDHCYAEKLVNGRMAGNFAERRRTSEQNWNLPLRWNRTAEKEGRSFRVFCASLADVFDNQVPELWRDDLWRLIAATPHLDWLLLTKRPQNIRRMLPVAEMGVPDWGDAGWPNVWLGTTAENQEQLAIRAWHLSQVPAAVRFLSCEPLLSALDCNAQNRWGTRWHVLTGGIRYATSGPAVTGRIHWVIAGGESGPGARPMHPDWARSLRDQCARAQVPFLFKQWGEWGLEDPARRSVPHAVARDGTLYAQSDLVFPDGPRYGEAVRAGHAGQLHTIYRVGKKAAGRLLDGREHNEFPR